MTEVKARFRMAKSLEEAAKLIFGKNHKTMRNFRSKKKLWEEGVYEDAPDMDAWKKRASKVGILNVDATKPHSKKKITLPTVKWLDKEEQK